VVRSKDSDSGSGPLFRIWYYVSRWPLRLQKQVFLFFRRFLADVRQLNTPSVNKILCEQKNMKRNEVLITVRYTNMKYVNTRKRKTGVDVNTA